MNKIYSWIDTHFDELTSMKTLVFIFSLVFNVILGVGAQHLLNRSDIAYKYIQELEEFVEDNGGLMDTVGSGDTYADYYDTW